MALAGLLPTRTTASPGGRTLAARAAMRGVSSLLISSRTRFPSRIRGILLNHNLRGCRAVPPHRGRRLELRAQRFRGQLRFLTFKLAVQFGRDLQEFPVSRLPNLEERAR